MPALSSFSTDLALYITLTKLIKWRTVSLYTLFMKRTELLPARGCNSNYFCLHFTQQHNTNIEHETRPDNARKTLPKIPHTKIKGVLSITYIIYFSHFGFQHEFSCKLDQDMFWEKQGILLGQMTELRKGKQFGLHKPRARLS